MAVSMITAWLWSGTQTSTALALHALLSFEPVLEAALVVGALTVDAARGSDGRRYPWGNIAFGAGGMRQANAGRIRCCGADDTDGLPPQPGAGAPCEHGQPEAPERVAGGWRFVLPHTVPIGQRLLTRYIALEIGSRLGPERSE